MFYGYLPDDNGLRGRCFVLMTVISAIHNLSRSLGVALLASSSDNMLAVYGGELLLYLFYKTVRGDLFYWLRTDGMGLSKGADLVLSIFAGISARSVSKVIVDFSGCYHFRHP